MSNFICSECGRWTTNKQHCYDAIITFLCIKQYTKTFDKLDIHIVKIIAKKVLETAGLPLWQDACMTIKWMNEEDE